MPLSRHRRDWEDLAVLDPLWAVSGKRATSDSPWTVSDFLATGEVEIEAVLGQAARLERPRRNSERLTSAAASAASLRLWPSAFSGATPSTSRKP